VSHRFSAILVLCAMRILYVSPYPPARDGLATYTAALVDAVRANGHEVRVIATDSGHQSPEEVIGSLSRSRDQRETLRAEIEAWAPDVVHLQFTVAGYTTRIFSLLQLLESVRGTKTRVFVTFHEATTDTALLRGVGRALYRRVVELADVVVVHTDASLAELTGRIGARPTATAVISHPRMDAPAPTTTPLELRERYGLDHARVLLFFGFLHVDKGLDDLVHAFHLLDAGEGAAIGDVRLVVAGEVPVRNGPGKPYELRNRIHVARIRRSIARWGLSDRVVFTGYVPSGEMAAWFRLASAVVLPYRRNEQSGVANLAAGLGAPLLVSEVGGLTELAATTGWSFPPRDPDELARTLAAFLRTEGEPGIRSSGAFAPSMAEIARETLALYDGCGPTLGGRYQEHVARA
jgi:glycosyltransferase involved in cell wall biosynthesis